MHACMHCDIETIATVVGLDVGKVRKWEEPRTPWPVSFFSSYHHP
jgi:hypothetical protein